MKSPVKVGFDQTISAAANYRAPQGANLYGWYNGRIAFFKAEEPEKWATQQRRQRGKWPFGQIPDESGNWLLSWPEYVYRDGPGHFYGEPKWTLVSSFKSEDKVPRMIPF